jgi:AraC-like DNA-binding protein/mannose-6-phosphate isomerase-like protein (cupin superfamily)
MFMQYTNHNQSTIMHKRSFVPVEFEEHFGVLPEDFPVHFFETDLVASPVRRLHVHKVLELGFCHEGSGIFIYGDRISSFSRGDVTVFPAGMPHYAKNSPGVQSKWGFIFFDPAKLLLPVCDQPEILSGLYTLSGTMPYVFELRKVPEVSALIERVFASHKRGELQFRTEIKSLLLQALILINRIRETREKEERHRGVERDLASIGRISPALNHISDNYTRRIKVAILAKLCGTSVETLRRLFRKSLGKSPEGYIQHLRIRTAVAFLEGTSDPIGDIAANVGYRTVSCFNRQFMKIMKISPRGWRKGIATYPGNASARRRKTSA